MCLTPKRSMTFGLFCCAETGKSKPVTNNIKQVSEMENIINRILEIDSLEQNSIKNAENAKEGVRY